ncbi:acyl-CoA thioesterase [Ralstonia pseudosolanacearum]
MHMPILSSSQTLTKIIERRQLDGCSVTFDVSEDWQQGRTLYGGLIATLAIQAMRDVCGRDWPLRALQTSFIGPVLPGRFEVDVTLLRQGKNVRQVQANIRQFDTTGHTNTACVLLAVFGAGRHSVLPEVTMAYAPTPKPPEQVRENAFLPAQAPTFTKHIEFRLATGGALFSGIDEIGSRTYLRMSDADAVDAELLSVIFSDAAPPPSLARLKSAAPFSSISWALELRPTDEVVAEGYWRIDKETLAAADGYINERSTLWTPDGRLAALGYQVVGVYA